MGFALGPLRKDDRDVRRMGMQPYIGLGRDLPTGLVISEFMKFGSISSIIVFSPGDCVSL